MVQNCYQKLRLATLSTWVVVASQADVGGERNGREKVQQRRWKFLVLVTTAAETYGFDFVSMRGT
jgi:hypothetical protein